MFRLRRSCRPLGTRGHVVTITAATLALAMAATVAAAEVAASVDHGMASAAVGTALGWAVAPSPVEDPGFHLHGLATTPAVSATPVATPAVVPAPVPVPVPPSSSSTTAAPPLTTRPLKVVFLGDSVSKTTASALAPLSATYGFSVSNRGILGCGVVRTAPFRYFGRLYDAVPPGCESWPQTWQGGVAQDQPDLAVILVGRWELMDRVVGGRWLSIGTPEFDADVAGSLDTAIAAAKVTGARVVLATTPYYRRGPRPDGGTWPEDDPARVDRFNALLREAAGRHPAVAVVELGERLSAGGRLAMTIDGMQVRTDGVHVAAGAGPLLAPWLLPQLREIASR